MKKIKILFILSIVVFLCSCAKYQVTSNPPGASVKINGRSFGITPTRSINIRRTYNIEISKSGYESYSGQISTSSPNPFHVELEKKPEKPEEKAGQYSLYFSFEDGSPTIEKNIVPAETNTIERSPNVKSVRRVTNLSEKSILSDFSLSPSGREIIFVQYEEEDTSEGTNKYSNLWSVPSAGGPLRRITQGAYFDNSPTLSSNGQDLYFSSNRLDSFDIWRLSYGSGAGLSLKTNSSGMSEFDPDLSTDGTVLLYKSVNRGDSIGQIWSTNLSNNEIYQLREGKWPKWTGSDQIIYSSMQRSTGQWKIWLMNSDGSSPVQISTGDNGNDIHASLSPDGRRIVFASDRARSGDKKNYDIWISDVDGSDLVQLTTNGSTDDMPVFSPDGKTVYFRSNRGIKWDIWSMKLAK